MKKETENVSVNNRDFKGVWIPREVWLDKRLNALDKIILIEIDSLDSPERGCWASNKYIAEFCQCSESKVTRSITKLKKYGYLYVRAFDGRTRELRSCLSKNAIPPRQIAEAQSANCRQSNIDNNIDNNKKERKSNSFDKILADYTSNEKTLDLLREWLKVRKAKRAAMTDRAIEMNIAKLDRLAEESGMSVDDYLSEVICRGWAAFYKIENYSKNRYGAKERVTINGKEYDTINGEYFVPNGSGIPVNPYADDDWGF